IRTSRSTSLAVALVLASSSATWAQAPNASQTATNKGVAARVPAPILVVDALVDGRDELRINRDGLEWVHHEAGRPPPVTLNGRLWDIQRKPRLTGDDLRRYFPNGADLTNLELALAKGRGTATLQSHTKDGMAVLLDDPYDGAGAFSVV